MSSTPFLALIMSSTLGLVACVAIWHKGYKDNLAQRAGLVTAALGSIFTVLSVLRQGPLENPLLWTLTGCAAFAAGTLFKRVRNHLLTGQP